MPQIYQPRVIEISSGADDSDCAIQSVVPKLKDQLSAKHRPRSKRKQRKASSRIQINLTDDSDDSDVEVSSSSKRRSSHQRLEVQLRQQETSPPPNTEDVLETPSDTQVHPTDLTPNSPNLGDNEEAVPSPKVEVPTEVKNNATPQHIAWNITKEYARQSREKSAIQTAAINKQVLAASELTIPIHDAQINQSPCERRVVRIKEEARTRYIQSTPTAVPVQTITTCVQTTTTPSSAAAVMKSCPHQASASKRDARQTQTPPDSDLDVDEKRKRSPTVEVELQQTHSEILKQDQHLHQEQQLQRQTSHVTPVYHHQCQYQYHENHEDHDQGQLNRKTIIEGRTKKDEQLTLLSLTPKQRRRLQQPTAAQEMDLIKARLTLIRAEITLTREVYACRALEHEAMVFRHKKLLAPFAWRALPMLFRGKKRRFDQVCKGVDT